MHGQWHGPLHKLPLCEVGGIFPKACYTHMYMHTCVAEVYLVVCTILNIVEFCKLGDIVQAYVHTFSMCVFMYSTYIHTYVCMYCIYYT